MTKNMSAVHRGIYILVGAALVALPFVTEIGLPWNILSPAMGVVSLVSGGIGL